MICELVYFGEDAGYYIVSAWVQFTWAIFQSLSEAKR